MDFNEENFLKKKDKPEYSSLFKHKIASQLVLAIELGWNRTDHPQYREFSILIRIYNSL